MLTEDQFKLAFRKAMDSKGKCFSLLDAQFAWKAYSKDPSRFSWILLYASRA